LVTSVREFEFIVTSLEILLAAQLLTGFKEVPQTLAQDVIGYLLSAAQPGPRAPGVPRGPANQPEEVEGKSEEPREVTKAPEKPPPVANYEDLTARSALGSDVGEEKQEREEEEDEEEDEGDEEEEEEEDEEEQEESDEEQEL